MSHRWTEIAIRFRRAPLSVFSGTDVTQMTPNWLVLRIQPDEGIALQFQVKRPGQTVTLAPISTSFVYKDWFPPLPNVGYETLIYDCMIGDAIAVPARRYGGGSVAHRAAGARCLGRGPTHRTFPIIAQAASGRTPPRNCSPMTAGVPGAPIGQSMSEERRMPHISLLLADVDGTLVTEQKVLTERAQAAVLRCATVASVSPSPVAGRRGAWRC